MTETNREVQASARLRTGVVLRDKMDKTVVVEVVRRYRHDKYSKFLRTRERYAAHDPENTCQVGDTVLLEETRPLSKTKRWRVREIIQRAAIV